MKITSIIGISLAVVLLTTSCNKNGTESDAYGNFEANEYVISAENSGKILKLRIEEGDVFNQTKQVGLIDTTQLYLQREQLKAQKSAVASGIKNILSRIAVYQEQISVLKKDKARIDQMFTDGAATSKQVDDINGGIQIAEKQIQAIKTENSKVLAELENLNHKIDALKDLIQKSNIIVPQAATVLKKYREPYEMVNKGTPLFKLADLRTLDLRVYISGDQISSVKIGQIVNVMIDKNEDEIHNLKGKVSWISSQSEFTPKIIQTKKERVKLVYAVKIKVANDGHLKIGMPGEVQF